MTTANDDTGDDAEFEYLTDPNGLAFPDYCATCRQQHAGDRTELIYEPVSVELLRRTWAVFRYQCINGHTWRCKYARDPRWVAQIAKRDPDAFGILLDEVPAPSWLF